MSSGGRPTSTPPFDVGGNGFENVDDVDVIMILSHMNCFDENYSLGHDVLPVWARSIFLVSFTV